MSERKGTRDPYGEIAERATEGTQNAHKEGTIRATKGAQKGTMEIYKIRMYKRDYEALKRHFEEKGMKVSTGVRSVIMEYMKRQGI